MPMGRDKSLTLICGKESIEYSHICLGDVWLAGGQSNMEFFLRYDADREEIFNGETDGDIRFFDMPRISYPEQIGEADFSRYGLWRTWDRENLDYFSAVPLYFAGKVRETLDVPIGIIGCNWGGSPACAWMDPSYLEGNPGSVWLDDYDEDRASLNLPAYEEAFKKNPANFKNHMFSDVIGERLLFGMDDGEMAEFMASPDYTGEIVPLGPLDFRRPGGLYENMLLKAAPLRIRGFLWYQGESDEKHPQAYDRVLTNMIRCWRDTWQEDLPFLMVQLAPFRKWLHCDGGTYPLLREKQDKVARSVANVWMASIMDKGMEKDIHPKEKKPVGERLALLALGKVYGYDLLCESPELARAERKDGEIILHFRHAPDGLFLSGKSLSCLEVDGAEGEVIKSLEGNRLSLKSDGFRTGKTVSVRFAWTDYCVVNLFNRAGLPVKPFSLILT
jgi:sialate O-acetylesterase